MGEMLALLMPRRADAETETVVSLVNGALANIIMLFERVDSTESGELTLKTEIRNWHCLGRV